MKKPSKDIAGLFLLLALGVILVFVYSGFLRQNLGMFSLPLDDAWIHLTFARNLACHLDFTYFPGDPSTSGSTSPLYTFLLGGGFFLSGNERAISAYSSVIFYLASLLMVFFLGRKILGTESILPVFLSLLFLLDWRVVWSALSGMETTLFIFFLLLALFFLTLEGWKKHLLSGLACGIALWVRPESLLLTFLVFLHLIIEARRNQSASDKKRGILLFGIFFLLPALGYILFNFLLSGTPLPNTFYAKGTFYREFSRIEYIGDVAGFFLYPFRPWYAPFHLILLAPFFLFSLYRAGKEMTRGRFPIEAVFSFFPLLLVAAYTWRIPLLFERGRYLQPALPFVLLSAGFSLAPFKQRIAKAEHGKLLLRGVVFIICILALTSAFRHKFEYYADCKFIHYRHVMAANWVRNNVPEGETIAVHDIGALGYYSGHRILDLAGLLDPGAARLMGDTEKQIALLKERDIHYFVIAPDWRQLLPLLKALPRRHLFPPRDEYPPPFRPMEVFQIAPEDVHENPQH